MRPFLVRLLVLVVVILVVFGIYRLITIQPLPSPAFFALQGSSPLALVDPGAVPDMPPFTPAAYDAALRAGADGFVVPLHLTRDGELVAVDTDDVAKHTDGKGQVGAMTAAEIAALDAGYRFDPSGNGAYPWRDAGQRLLTLEQILAAYPTARVVANLQQPTLRSVAALLQAVDAADARQRVLAVVDDQQLVEALREQAPLLATAATSGERTAFITMLRLRLSPFHRPASPAMVLDRSAVDQRLTAAAHRRGVFVVTTAADASDAQALHQIGVDAIIVADPAAVRSMD